MALAFLLQTKPKYDGVYKTQEASSMDRTRRQ